LSVFIFFRWVLCHSESPYSFHLTYSPTKVIFEVLVSCLRDWVPLPFPIGCQTPPSLFQDVASRDIPQVLEQLSLSPLSLNLRIKDSPRPPTRSLKFCVVCEPNQLKVTPARAFLTIFTPLPCFFFFLSSLSYRSRCAHIEISAYPLSPCVNSPKLLCPGSHVIHFELSATVPSLGLVPLMITDTWRLPTLARSTNPCPPGFSRPFFRPCPIRLGTSPSTFLV